MEVTKWLKPSDSCLKGPYSGGFQSLGRGLHKMPANSGTTRREIDLRPPQPSLSLGVSAGWIAIEPGTGNP